ncbi:hypothetical protein P7K49_035195 [Saguinus oedipus]|uniref:Receptor ligand binding region domain-containing protein n=1 Tax=Saguinus oedipus TaxID=9490 RepID=A0ABQ9TXZ2_SAGOE|nr:hypothetical protein P7K49_035195 [Saguinus oedipus]
MPSDLTNVHTVAQLVLHFRWSWVGVLAQEGDFGLQSSSLVVQELGQAGVCMELSPHPHPCTSNSSCSLAGRDILGQVWVSQDTLHMALALTTPSASQVLQGSFSLLFRYSQL